MKKVLIISPHYPPSNLAAVHRARLFAQHLPRLGWLPIILTVDEKYYEEKLDWNLHLILPAGQRIEKVKAFRIFKPRLIGDIGLRAFYQLRKRALRLVQEEKIDFVYIPIPSFYTSLIGPFLHRKTGVKYGIDYIDPWVHTFPGSEKRLSRHWWSTKLAKYLEPIAVKSASLITGVAEGYFKNVFERNPRLREHCLSGAMPYGGEIEDHEKVMKLNAEPYLFSKNGKIQLVYAGAMLPKAYAPLKAIFKSIVTHIERYRNVEIHFIGTGKTPNDEYGFNIKPIAEEFGLWQSVVFEYPKRIPYLDVLVHLNAADGVVILGSTEPHYTPSKTYQAVLSGKPFLAVLHHQSTAVEILRNTAAGVVLSFDGESEITRISDEFTLVFEIFLRFKESFQVSQVDLERFRDYSAHAVTKKLVELLNRVNRNGED